MNKFHMALVRPACAISAALIVYMIMMKSKRTFELLFILVRPMWYANEILLLGFLCLQMLSRIRSEILSGCKIVFSRVFPTKFHAENHQLWKLAEQLGATCLTELDPSVTHVVAMDTGTEKARWAVQQKKFLVNPRWIEAASYLWRRLPEDQFLITPRDVSEKHKEEQKAYGVMGNGFVS